MFCMFAFHFIYKLNHMKRICFLSATSAEASRQTFMYSTYFKQSFILEYAYEQINDGRCSTSICF